jgi:hypothetical protein
MMDDVSPIHRELPFTMLPSQDDGIFMQYSHISVSVSVSMEIKIYIKYSNAELNPICQLLALLGAHHILHVSRISVNVPLDLTSLNEGVYGAKL